MFERSQTISRIKQIFNSESTVKRPRRTQILPSLQCRLHRLLQNRLHRIRDIFSGFDYYLIVLGTDNSVVKAVQFLRNMDQRQLKTVGPVFLDGQTEIGKYPSHRARAICFTHLRRQGVSIQPFESEVTPLFV